MQKIIIPFISSAIGNTFFLFILIFNISLSTFSQSLKIYHIDVEQADATLVISPQGKTLLIDSGSEGDGSRVKSILDAESITSVDYYVCTHYHKDHYGGIDELVQAGISFGKCYDRGDTNCLPQTKLDERAYKNYQVAVDSNATHLTRGEMIPLGDVTVRCIASGGVVLNEDPYVSGADENDMSIALLIQYGDFLYFTGGDIEIPTEKKIADRDLVTDVDVCKSDHHGSHKCSLQSFMEDLNPSVIIISNGSHGSYFHPRQVTLDNYMILTPTPLVLQTNKYLKTDSRGGNVEDKYIADLETVDEDGDILIEVTPSSNQYTISYRDTTITMDIKQRTPPVSVVIESLLPNPASPDLDYDDESVTLRNDGNQTVSLTGCYLVDASDRIWSLDGKTIPANGSLTIYRNRMPMSLNNGGDEIRLIGQHNQPLDDFSYNSSQEGIELITGH